MIINVLLTLGLLVCAGYALMLGRGGLRTGWLMLGTIGAGLYFVWRPEHSTKVANLLGVGRGADLVMYLWIVLSILMHLGMQRRVQLEARRLTELARAVGLERALRHEPPEPGGTQRSDAERDSPGL
jgi:small membrane protein